MPAKSCTLAGEDYKRLTTKSPRVNLFSNFLIKLLATLKKFETWIVIFVSIERKILLVPNDFFGFSYFSLLSPDFVWAWLGSLWGWVQLPNPGTTMTNGLLTGLIASIIFFYSSEIQLLAVMFFLHISFSSFLDRSFALKASWQSEVEMPMMTHQSSIGSSTRRRRSSNNSSRSIANDLPWDWIPARKTMMRMKRLRKNSIFCWSKPSRFKDRGGNSDRRMVKFWCGTIFKLEPKTSASVICVLIALLGIGALPMTGKTLFILLCENNSWENQAKETHSMSKLGRARWKLPFWRDSFKVINPHEGIL